MVKISTSIAEHVHLKTWDFTRQQAWKGAPFATWRKSKDNACCDNHTQVQKTGGTKKKKRWYFLWREQHCLLYTWHYNL
jgi:hypothetical protein